MKQLMRTGKRTRILLFILLFAVTMLLTLAIGGTQRIKASELREEREVYISIQIHFGDTLCSIAQEYPGASDNTADSMKKIAELNQICYDETIRAGQYLLVPVILEDRSGLH